MQKVFGFLKTAGVVGLVLLTVFFAARALGLLDSHVKSQRIAAANNWPSGVVYRLNRLVLDVSATFEVTACGTVAVSPLAGDAKDEAGKLAYRVVDVAIADSKITPRLEADPAQAWLIQSGSLEGWWFSTTFAATLDAVGRLKEVNSTSTSLKAGDVIKPILDFAGALGGPAGDAVGAPGAASAFVESDEMFCGKSVTSALARRAEIEKRLLAASPDERLVLQSELAKTTAVLRKSFSATLTPRRPEAALDVRREDNKRLQALGLGILVDPQPLFTGLGNGLRSALADRAFEIRVLVGVPPAHTPVESVNGIVHRVPVDGRVVACRKQCRFDASGDVAAEDLLQPPETVAVPQLGIDAVIPIRRTPFSDRKARLTFDANGALTVLDVSDTAQPPK